MQATLETLVELERLNDITIARFRPQTLIDDAAVQAVHSMLCDHIESGILRKLALDLTHLRFISSSALGMLVGIRLLLDEQKGRLRVFGLNSMMRELISLSNLTTMLGVCESQAQATSSMMSS